MKQVPCIEDRSKEKYNQIYAHNFLFQKFVNIPLNWLDTKLVTIDERCHQIY